jgi:hypothetical protein
MIFGYPSRASTISTKAFTKRKMDIQANSFFIVGL